MKTIGIIGAGHPFKYQYKALKKIGYKLILCDKDLNKIKKYPEEKYQDYKELVGKVDMVLISTPPITHLEIIKYFINLNIFVICEKPLVTKYEDLTYLFKNYHKFYNILHFSYGEEIEWFIKNGNIKNIRKIIAYINDPYIKNNHIKNAALSLNGAYLDETINPLSAVARIFKTNPQFVDAKLSYYKDDVYDYKAISHFMIDDVHLEINVIWNDLSNREKYIDIYYDDYILRLDSFNQKVINLTTNKFLFSFKGIRMYQHYLNGFNNLFGNKNNTFNALKINEAVMEYFK